MLGLIVGAPLASIALHSMIPTVAAVAIIAVLAIRTAIRHRSKAAATWLRGYYSVCIRTWLRYR